MTDASSESALTSRRVAAWNIYLDHRHPQHERRDSIIETLKSQDEFDLVGIIEAQKTKEYGHSGEIIAQEISGTDGLWYPHSRKKQGEHIGVFGPDIQSVEPIEIGYNRTAVRAYLGNVAIVTVHLKRQKQHVPALPEQREQVEKLLEVVGNEEQVVIFGDFNILRRMKPRKIIEDAGFESVFTALDLPRPKFPTDKYRDILDWRQKLGLVLAGGAINIDDIYAKGIRPVNAGRVEGDADHELTWLEYTEQAS